MATPVQNLAIGGRTIILAAQSVCRTVATISRSGHSAPPADQKSIASRPTALRTHLWSSRDDLVYALGFDQHGRLIAGTGNRGHIFAINGVDDFTDLLKASASQITAFAAAPGGGLYASSSNLGKIFVLGPGPESEGSYESDVFDAHVFSRWGRASMRSAGNVELYARSGNVDNPDRNWSPWTRVDLAGEFGTESSPGALRAVEGIRAAMRRAEPASPHVDSVLLNYLPKNVAPRD